jgi:hypothetical protein
LAVLGPTRKELAYPSASAHAHPTRRFAHTGHGSLHVDFKASTEAWRSFREQACCKQHASPTRQWEEAHPTVSQSHHSLPCRLIPPGTMQDPMVRPVGDAPGQKPPILYSIFCLPEGLVCANCAGHCGVGCSACCTGPTCLLAMVVFESFGQRQWTPRVQP